MERTPVQPEVYVNRNLDLECVELDTWAVKDLIAM